MRHIVPAVAICTMLSILPRGAARAGDDPAPEEIVKQLDARADAIRNGYSVNLWEQFVDGEPTRWTRATVQFDKRGPDGETRARYFAERGVYDDGKRALQRTECCLYNGHITVEFRYNYRHGRLADANGIHASIYHGPRPGEGGPLSMHNPFRSTTTRVLSEMKQALKDGRPVRVSSPGGIGEGLYEVEFTRFVTEKAWRFDYIAVLDSKRSWSPVSLDVTNRDGKHVQSHQATYGNTATSGVWMPVAGSSKQLIEHTIKSRSAHGHPIEISLPAHEWRFRVLELAVNDPQFSDDVFQIVLEPGTYVWEGRYRVDYRVGNERAFESDLVRLAEEALARQRMRSAEDPD